MKNDKIELKIKIKKLRGSFKNLQVVQKYGLNQAIVEEVYTSQRCKEIKTCNHLYIIMKYMKHIILKGYQTELLYVIGVDAEKFLLFYTTSFSGESKGEWNQCQIIIVMVVLKLVENDDNTKVEKKYINIVNETKLDIHNTVNIGHNMDMNLVDYYYTFKKEGKMLFTTQKTTHVTKQELDSVDLYDDICIYTNNKNFLEEIFLQKLHFVNCLFVKNNEKNNNKEKDNCVYEKTKPKIKTKKNGIHFKMIVIITGSDSHIRYELIKI